MTTQGMVAQAVRAVCPNIDGITFKVLLNPATWRIDFSVDEKGRFLSSPAQREAAQAVIDNFDLPAAQAKMEAARHLQETDAKMARLVEDIVDNSTGLLAKLPAASQELIAERKTLRAEMNS